jgi:hypothetical protein
LGQSTLVVLCAGSTLPLAQSYAQIGAIYKLSGVSPSHLASTFGSGFFSPTSSIKPWFRTKGNSPLCSSYLPLRVPNWVAKHRQSSIFLALLPGRKKISARESLASNLLLCYCFAYFLYFIFICIFLSKIQKN